MRLVPSKMIWLCGNLTVLSDAFSTAKRAPTPLEQVRNSHEEKKREAVELLSCLHHSLTESTIFCHCVLLLAHVLR